MFKVKTKRVNPDWAKKLSKALDGLKRKEVAVGFPMGTEAAAVTYPEGQSVLEVAVWNEYGVPAASGGKGWRIPPRPFMEQSIDRIKADSSGVMSNLVKSVQSGKVEPGKALNIVALFAEGAVKEEITDGVFAPNAPRTVKRKKSDHPLIDTGKMRQSVVAVVRPRSA